MKKITEIRQCAICIQLFTTTSKSNRKTCSVECSIHHGDKTKISPFQRRIREETDKKFLESKLGKKTLEQYPKQSSQILASKKQYAKLKRIKAPLQIYDEFNKAKTILDEYKQSDNGIALMKKAIEDRRQSS